MNLCVCVAGFLMGLGLLHGSILAGLIGLLLTVVLALLTLATAIAGLIWFRVIGGRWLLASIVIPASALSLTLYMVFNYPQYKVRTSFARHQVSYQAAAKLALLADEMGQQKNFKLPSQLQFLSAKGEVKLEGAKGSRTLIFDPSSNLQGLQAFYIVYRDPAGPTVNSLQEEANSWLRLGEELAPGWYMGLWTD